MSPKTIASAGQACAQAVVNESRGMSVLFEAPAADLRGDLRLLDALHAEGAFLHHAAHPHGDVRILLHLDRVGRAFLGQRPEVFLVNGEFARIFSLPIGRWL